MHFGLRGRLPHVTVIKSVVWSPLSPGWVKVNMNGADLGSPGVRGCGVSMAINYAWINDWRRIWLESDSSYVVQLLSARSDKVQWCVWQAWHGCLS
ncbi:hypothetical protein Dsin_027869 [Dipteronia sinensis]|uniref:RNase H type-1 domain-containing protein n=1 Tax=Dipteronia sinensis TaxID=43782 RepID=A0AAD9ZP99_9ROSI|nr:hypothetical protein Dsin_027869 [Dipteronia sinensis]